MEKANKTFLSLVEALRPTQWIKNLSIFAAILLNGQLLNTNLFSQSFFAFVAFCGLSSAAYLINDFVDRDKDRLHPVKKHRPLARGDISPTLALITSAILIIFGLTISLSININFFLLALTFILLQFVYSFLLKKKALFDIIGISIFFIIRAYAGEVATGYHLPVWIMLTVVFLSLFIASGKRRSELVNSGSKTRSALKGYGRTLLTFYTSIFAVSTLITYAMFTYLAEPVFGRKWFMATLLPVIFGIMRYGQIIFEMQEGERPEKIVTTDIPLMASVLVWGVMMIVIVYAPF